MVVAIIIGVFVVVFFVIMPLLARSYEKEEKKHMTTIWEDFVKKSPNDAKAVEDYYKEDLAALSNGEVHNRLAALRRMCNNMNCTISELHDTFIKELDRYPIETLPDLITTTEKLMYEESHDYLTEPKDTGSALLIRWIKERQKRLQESGISSDIYNIKFKNKEAKNEPSVPKSYWEQFQLDNESEAQEILSLGITFDGLPDEDVKERITALRNAAIEDSCSISELKTMLDKSLKQNNIGEAHYARMRDSLNERTSIEMEKLNIKKENTFKVLMQKWLNEKVEEILNRNNASTPRSKKRPTLLLMQFSLEDSDQFSVNRKMQIYLKNYPMTDDAKDLIQQIEELYDPDYREALEPVAQDEALRQSPALFNQYLKTKAYMVTKSIKSYEDSLKNNIELCNEEDISFYEELELLEEKEVAKYSI